MTQQTRAYNVHADSDKPLIVEGLPIVFDQPAQIGDVTEVIARTALDGVDLSNITLQVNHDNQSIPLARSPETMTLTVTEKGLAMTATLPDTERWAGLRSIGMVERTCQSGDTQTLERRYFINAIAADAKRFAHAVRGHWGVENRLHWRLDVVFNEDASRIRKGHAPAIMTSLRHLCINLFEQEPSSLGLAKKRRKAGWNDAYRAKVVFG